VWWWWWWCGGVVVVWWCGGGGRGGGDVMWCGGGVVVVAVVVVVADWIVLLPAGSLSFALTTKQLVYAGLDISNPNPNSPSNPRTRILTVTEP
jgi:hypothetical protein